MSRVLMVPLSDEEEAVVSELLIRGGFRGDDHLVKCGIGQIADRYDIPMSEDAFAVPYNPKLRVLLDRERPHQERDTPLLDLDELERQKQQRGA
jgi:hypothetical protein